MKNKILSLTITLILLSSAIIIFNTDKADAHKKKNHKPTICILEEDRTDGQKNSCKIARWWHRLCKLDSDCALLKIEEQEGKIIDLEDKLGGVAECGDSPSKHKTNKKTKVYK